MAVPPLEDPAYVPEHPPVNGVVPDVVAKWGPQSQLRWFRRFMNQVTPMRASGWDRFYCNSVEHRGLCCESCAEDAENGYGSFEEHCCCYAVKGD